LLDQDDKENWKKVKNLIKEKFDAEEEVDVDTILFLIGVRELGTRQKKFKKDQKLDLMHIAICRVLSPYGYYKLEGIDDEGWPHYSLQEKLPYLKAGEQSILMKQAIIRYFKQEGLLEEH
jgi:hypothetical protein